MCNSVMFLLKNLKSRFRFRGLSFFLFLILTVFFNVHLKAQGNLMVNPKRVVFEGQKRIMEVNLSNVGLDSAKYSISILQLRMTDDGKFEEITTPDPGQNFADKNIRFFPRSVILAPNETQVVKLQLTKSDQLEPGEYRSHLYFKSLNELKALGEEVTKNDSTVSIKIIPVFGITIPVIIRVGESNTILNITDLKLETAPDGSIKLNLKINRTGNMSAFGDLSISYIAPNGKKTKIGLAKGIAVYSPNFLRNVKVDLEINSEIDLSKGAIKVLYESQLDTRPEKLAEAELVL
jgi:uncharacterized membrane protein